jgi:hypothetical protein
VFVALFFAPMSFPLASDCERLVVGQTYLVPTVNGNPIIGDPHSDNDHLNRTPEEHYHPDTRFAGKANDAIRNRPLIRRGELQAYDETPPVTLEPFVCIRETPDADIKNFAGATMSLYLDYGHSKSVCGKCPHKGMPIQNGICTGHRLQWLPDGTAKHKPPYTLTIRGTKNHVTYTERVTFDLYEIEITEAFDGPIVIDMTDRDGFIVSTMNFSDVTYKLEIGDSFKVGNTRGH